MPRLNPNDASDLEVLGRLYSENVRSYQALHLTLRVKNKSSSNVEAEGVDIYMTDCYKDLTLTIDGETNLYQATGNLLNFESVKESTDLQVSRMQVTLSGVDRTFTAALLLYEYLDQPMRVHRVFLDQHEVVRHTPMLSFSGNTDSPTISDDPSSGTSTITLSAASNFVDFERRSGRKTNQSEQDLFRSINSLSDEDTGYEFNALSAAEIWWGRGSVDED